MGRLKAITPRLGAMTPRLGRASGDEQARDRERNEAQPWRGWYRTKRWRDLRMAAFERDLWTCQRSGELLLGRHPAPNSPVANHRRPHRGDPALFWDIDNIETVSKAVHDGLVQAQERAAEAGGRRG